MCACQLLGDEFRSLETWWNVSSLESPVLLFPVLCVIPISPSAAVSSSALMGRYFDGLLVRSLPSMLGSHCGVRVLSYKHCVWKVRVYKPSRLGLCPPLTSAHVSLHFCVKLLFQAMLQQWWVAVYKPVTYFHVHNCFALQTDWLGSTNVSNAPSEESGPQSIFFLLYFQWVRLPISWKFVLFLCRSYMPVSVRCKDYYLTG